MTCPDCGHRNAPGAQFCASCRAFLDWEDAADQTDRAGRGAAGAPPDAGGATGRPPAGRAPNTVPNPAPSPPPAEPR
ncbi:zinc-ribbon domain-containing protein, partial [Streptomyces sp. AC563]|nr:zinc-ribbon domain-containing protein [Streptomyces buecherae]